MLKINPEKETKKIVQFIKKTLKDKGFKKCIIALSGGLDSSTTLLLLNKTIGPKNIIGLKLPYGKQNLNDAEKIIKRVKIPPENIFKVDIKPIVDKITQSIIHHPLSIINLRQGNIMVRIRMIILYDLAKANHALVCGTENKSEYLLGYFTLFGDQASDIAPLRHLYKSQLIQLAKYLGVPRKIISKPPTAGLWPGQTDEKELGFSYPQADPILSLVFDKKLNFKQIIKKGFKKELVLKVLRRVKENSFKHQLPYCLT